MNEMQPSLDFNSKWVVSIFYLNTFRIVTTNVNLSHRLAASPHDALPASETARWSDSRFPKKNRIVAMEMLLGATALGVFLAPIVTLFTLIFGQVTELSHTALIGHSARKLVSMVGRQKSDIFNGGNINEIEKSSASSGDVVLSVPFEAAFLVPPIAPQVSWMGPADEEMEPRLGLAAAGRAPPSDLLAPFVLVFSVLVSFLVVVLPFLPAALRRQSPGSRFRRFLPFPIPFEPAGEILARLNPVGRVRLALDSVRRGLASVEPTTKIQCFSETA